MTASRPMGPGALKLRLRAWLLKAGGIKRIHIVGCARSGTTMLHYSMVAFGGTILIDRETSVHWTPSLKESGILCRDHVLRRAPVYLVTKRAYGWFLPGQLDQLIDCTMRERIGIINLVRDPRDVLTSRHPGDISKSSYVEPRRWSASTRAADELFARLEAYPHKLTLRYEDVVTDPVSVGHTLARRFSLQLRPNIGSFARLRDNLEKLDASTRMAESLHSIRNFDPATIGRWKKNPEHVAYLDALLTKSEIRDELKEFMQRYDYPIHSATAFDERSQVVRSS